MTKILDMAMRVGGWGKAQCLTHSRLSISVQSLSYSFTATWLENHKSGALLSNELALLKLIKQSSSTYGIPGPHLLFQIKSLYFTLHKIMTVKFLVLAHTHCWLLMDPNMFSLGNSLRIILNIVSRPLLPTSRSWLVWLNLFVILELLIRSFRNCFSVLIW